MKQPTKWVNANTVAEKIMQLRNIKFDKGQLVERMIEEIKELAERIQKDPKVYGTKQGEVIKKSLSGVLSDSYTGRKGNYEAGYFTSLSTNCEIINNTVVKAAQKKEKNIIM